MKAIVVGHTCVIGDHIKRSLEHHGFEVTGWSRITGVNVMDDSLVTAPQPASLDLVVNVAETGLLGLKRVWVKTAASLASGRGMFVFISSIAAVIDNTTYAQSKLAQENGLVSLFRNAQPVRVNCIRLGHVLGTEAWPSDHSLGDRRFITPVDVADTVIFLYRCNSVVGQIITVDGGELLRAK